MIIQHNIMALNAHRQLGGNNSIVSKNLEKLSSGFRINRAGDDAAGLGMSEKMRAQITGLSRAQSNAQDGISLVQTAEGALTEVHSMLNRMVDLSTQSANGTMQADDRQRVQDEMKALTEEIDRISQSTNYNGINLLDGSLGGSKAGGGLVGGKVFNIKAATTGAVAGAVTLVGHTDFSEEILKIDGTEVKIDWSQLTDDEKATLLVDVTAGQTDSSAKKIASILEKHINAAVDQTNRDTGSGINHVTVKGTQTGGGASFEIVSGLTGNKSSGILLDSGTNNSGNAGTELLNVLLGGQQDVSATTSFAGTSLDLNGTFNVVLDGEEFTMSTAGIVAADTEVNILAALNAGLTTALTNYEAAKGITTAGEISGKMSFTVNNEGRFELVNTSGIKVGFSDTDNGETAKNFGISAEGKSISSGLTLQIGDTSDDFNKVTVSVEDMSAAGLNIAGIQVGQQGVSAESIATIKSAINKVSTNRSAMGALQNRLEHTINNLGVAAENMTAAESRIRDVDMAKEMMNFTKNNVLSQAAQAMLAQANQQPQQVLQLLR